MGAESFIQSVMDTETPNDVGDEAAETEETAEDQAAETEETSEKEESTESTDKPETAESDPAKLVTSLTERLEALEKQNRGLEGRGTAEVKKRQAVEAKLAKVMDFLQKIQANPAEEGAKPKPKFKGLPIAMTEDGEAYVPEEQIEEFLKGKLKPIEDGLHGVSARNQAQEEQSAINKVISTIVGEDQQYQAIYDSSLAAWNDLMDMTTKQYDGRAPKPETDAVVQAVLDTPVAEAFEKKYPSIDLMTFIEAFTSRNPKVWTRKLRKVLDSQVKVAEEKPDNGKATGITAVQKKLAEKPNSLAGRRAAIGPQPTDLDLIADIDDPLEFKRRMDNPKNRDELHRLMRELG